MDEKVEEDVNSVKGEDESEDMGTETGESDTESEKEENVEPESPQIQEQSQADDIVYEELELLPSPNTISKEELEDDDVELWLVRVPGHDTLIDSVVGSTIPFTDDGATSNSPQTGKTVTDGYGKKCSRLTGSYYFRNHGSTGLDNMRALAVVRNDDGESSLLPGMLGASSKSVPPILSNCIEAYGVKLTNACTAFQ